MILLIFLQMVIFWLLSLAAAGNPKRISEFSHMAYCCLELDSGDEYLRQGTLISKEYITLNVHLIAGYTLDKVTCIVGAQNISQYEPHQVWYDVPTSNVVAHEGFVGPKSVVNNIALIKLPEPIKPNDYVQPARLPPLGHNSKNLLNVKLTGIALDSESGTTAFRAATVGPGYECKRKYVGFGKGNFCSLTNQSDSSIHYFLKDGKEPHTLIGYSIFSSPINPNLLRRVSCRIDYYLQWIHDHTNIPSRYF